MKDGNKDYLCSKCKTGQAHTGLTVEPCFVHIWVFTMGTNVLCLNR